MKIKGIFEVKLSELPAHAEGKNGITLNRMSIDKLFSGDLEAESKGEMLTAMTPIRGSAGYVAVEQVQGTLSGKKGSFVLQHFGIMSGENEKLILEVIPDSGTDELMGLSGTMNIIREDGKHIYEFDYTFAK
ncbi:DUF3224 domain-containing protein [Balneola sp. MJW-20]|uniref:DUF3224 domain-containing protein n=1 Tax=Gracilimonas aurantiaca TaxID=3234185 RepID=UPI003465C2C1